MLGDRAEIDRVAVPGTRGEIGMTAFPEAGRPGSSRFAAIAAVRPGLVVTLVEPFEYAMLGAPDFVADVAGSGLPWAFAPIADGAAPGPRFEAAWPELALRARGVLHGGGLVILHCRAGLGRTGTIAARLLIECGTAPADAIRAVRAARPGAIQTPAQERYVRALRPPG